MHRKIDDKYEVWIDPKRIEYDRIVGGFEWDGGSEEEYAEGNMWFNTITKEMEDYDGIPSLDQEIIDIVNEFGYKTNKI